MKKESIKAIKTMLATIDTRADHRLDILRNDPRQGVQQALVQWERRIEKQEKAEKLQEKMFFFEREKQREGYHWIAGIDEVGRGPLAGPVVAAAVILSKDFYLLGVNDSKQLSAKKRAVLYEEICKQALAIGIGMVDHQTIDEINIYQASKRAMTLAVNKLAQQPDCLLIDAMALDLPIAQESLIKGDARSVSIAAASIVAKVVRDRLMEEYGKTYPGYGFEKNAGYGTKEHLLGLKKQGICPIHRKTFSPVKNFC